MVALLAETCSYVQINHTLPQVELVYHQPRKGLVSPEGLNIPQQSIKIFSSKRKSIPDSLNIPQQNIRMFPGGIQGTTVESFPQRSLKKLPQWI